MCFIGKVCEETLIFCRAVRVEGFVFMGLSFSFIGRLVVFIFWVKFGLVVVVVFLCCRDIGFVLWGVKEVFD